MSPVDGMREPKRLAVIMLRKVTLYIAGPAQFSNGLTLLNDDDDVNVERFLNLLNPDDDLNGYDFLNLVNANADAIARAKREIAVNSFVKDKATMFGKAGY